MLDISALKDENIVSKRYAFTNAHILCQNGEHFTNGSCIIENHDIIEVGDIEIPSDVPTIDLKGRILMPSFICAHGHFYGMFSRGMPLKDEAPSNFKEVLERLWWRLDKALDEKANYLSAAIVLCDAIKAGTTTIFDHHASPYSVPGSLDSIAKAIKDAGVRGSLCYEVSDRDGRDIMIQGVAENNRFHKSISPEMEDFPHQFHSLFGLHAACTCGDETLNLAKESLEENYGVHVHVAEGQFDVDVARDEYQTTVVKRLHKEGLTGPDSIFVHCVCCDDDELEILKETNTWVVHNPQSNMNNAVGVSDVPKMLEMGIPVCLGTDGMTMDMIEEVKCLYLLHKLNKKDPRQMGWDTFKILFENNAKMASHFFKKEIGVLKAGAAADLVILDYANPTELHPGNFPWHLRFGMSRSNVNTTICAGKPLMVEREILTLDEMEIAKQCREIHSEVWEKF
eukprot:TRINITY_DN11706_c0_g1_i1.p1 TRINITY_DN11706_c0_g1~~TRINITY_DN11706_c0_g1_i1.p1  ORF type:complete len:454 (+),score=161.96 TRINITY_DN11706_c0_g1_i1:25-1386(+)